ncbi:alkaline phosphatase [Rathayibacter sp. VKM Ac-2929]|uniref:alkaline phosphatase n=1 Tax=unclassified Rathayibacter TaxID=2609250 RepID=UPI001FB4267B|nr:MULTISPECIES: alkaline phosphatase [unclassified Rathayibacter]MCJ1675711.1 alkaline phosphatase [Rathayibacter sp. VKM Ac-2929]
MTRLFRSAPRGRSAVALSAAALICGAALAAPSIATAAGNADFSTTGGAARISPVDADLSDSLRAEIKEQDAKNVILLIGDGMGDSEITIARNYEYGAAGRLPGIDALPITGQYTTYSLYRADDPATGAVKGAPDYVPDSAATGSAWATGTKTYDNAVSVDIDQERQDTLLEIAKANGLKTGNVTTSEVQDATPAVQAAHVDARSCYGPDSPTCGNDALENGGLGSISEQILGTRADVTLGGGSASFAQVAKAGDWAGRTLFDQAADRGYQVLGDATTAGTAAQLEALTAADQDAPVLGLFGAGNLPVRYAPTPATVGGGDAAPQTCVANPARPAEQPTLRSMTEKAIDLLNTGDKGFFLQVEGASIDKQDHAANACGQIGETVDLDEAVQAALAFAKADGNTLVIVTADHAHSSQIVDSTPPTSLSTALKTADGSTMKVSYGTAAEGGSQQHTGSQLRIAGYGPGAANVAGLTDQTDTFFTISNALGLDRDIRNLSFNATASLSGTSFTPGEEITLTAADFNGDTQLIGSAPLFTDRTATRDLIDGGLTVTAKAPTTPGDYSVTVTGDQTGKAITLPFTVTEPTKTTTTKEKAADIAGKVLEQIRNR